MEYMNTKAVRAAADFSVRLLQNTYDANNALISPLSLLSVLSMVQLGARGGTKEELDAVIGVDTMEMVELLKRLPMAETEKKADDRWSKLVGDHRPATVNFANALWLNDNGKVQFNPNYLSCGKALFHADVQTLPFDDAAFNAINQWTNEKTKGRITYVVDSLSEDTAMFLANALFFDGKWAVEYQPSNVKQRIFKNVNGKERLVDFMESEESYYLHDYCAKGFIKSYCGGRYAFVALLPDEGVSLREYVECLTGEKLQLIVGNPLKHKVNTRMPKFTVDQKVDLKQPLLEMGIHNAFNRDKADFSGIGKAIGPRDNLCVGDVWQINKIKVDEEGTQAVSFTGIDVMCMKSCVESKPYRVYLDRPFLYMIIDMEINLPLFMGTVDTL